MPYGIYSSVNDRQSEQHCEQVTFIPEGGTIRLMIPLFYFSAGSRKIGRVQGSFLADSNSKCRKLVVRGRHTSATELSRFLVRDGVVPPLGSPLCNCACRS